MRRYLYPLLSCILLWTFLAPPFLPAARASGLKSGPQPSRKNQPAAAGGPAVFQYAVPVATGKAPSTAFLWIPPRARQVRGVVMAGMTLMEREFVKDARIRQACAGQQLALVFLKCGLGAVEVEQVLADLAQASGYRELAVAPLLFVGHSAGGPQAKALATRLASRCFGLVQYRGGVPGPMQTTIKGGEGSVPAGVPTLMMLGQFDEFGGTMRNESGRESWQGGRDALAAYRAASPGHLASIVVEPGAGHFAWSELNAHYLALWIGKAAAAGIPARWPVTATTPVLRRTIDPGSGWLSDLAIEKAGTQAPAAYARYRGDKSQAAWHFDRELARATVAYHAGALGRKDQFLKWQDAYSLDAGVRHFFHDITWVGDGQTLQVHPAYADRYPAPQPGGPRWAAAGQPLGHAPVPILVKPVSGPVVATGPDTFRFQYDNLAPATEPGRVTFMAYSTGDGQYRYTELVGMLPRAFQGLTSGKEQKITFPAIGNLKKGAAPVALQATSDAGLPCEYYVAYGPAKVVDGRLVIADVPARATYPIEVKVVAYQFGRGVAPLVRAAAPVTQTLLIQQP